MVRELAARSHLPRSLLLTALSATLLVSLLLGTAFVACGPDGKRCAKTQTFLEAPVKMDVDVMEGTAAHVHHGHHAHAESGGWWKDIIKKIKDRISRRRSRNPNPNSIPWGDIPEDNRTDEENIHCSEIKKDMDKKIADGEWPMDTPASRTGNVIPCEKGEAEADGATYACEGVDLLSFVPLSDFGSLKANDVWGWTDPLTQKEYAIIGLGEGTGFVDISDPTLPVVLAVMPTTTRSSTWRDIKVYQNRAYVVSEAYAHGMQVFDLTRLRDRTGPPTQPDQADFHMKDFGSAHNIVINEATGRAYAVGARNYQQSQRFCRGGLAIIDIREAIPHFEGCFEADGYTHDAECVVYHGEDTDYNNENSGPREICFAYNENSLTIVDVTRGSPPTQISRLGYQNSQYTHQGWLDEEQGFAYMNDELDEMRDSDQRTRTFIFDVRDLDNPLLYNTYWHDTLSIDHNNYIKGKYIYQGNYCAGLRILKIGDDHNVQEVAYFDTEPQCDVARFEGVWSVYPYFPSGTIVVSSVPKGLFMFRADSLP